MGRAAVALWALVVAVAVWQTAAGEGPGREGVAGGRRAGRGFAAGGEVRWPGREPVRALRGSRLHLPLSPAEQLTRGPWRGARVDVPSPVPPQLCGPSPWPWCVVGP